MEEMQSVESRLKNVEELVHQGKPEEALELVNTMDDSDEMGGLVCFIRGNVYRHLGQATLADESYNLALNKGFVDYKLFINLAGLNVKMAKLGQAELYYRQAAELDPTDIFPITAICELRFETGDVEGAKTAAQEMMSRHPALFDGFQRMYDLLHLLGKADEAKELLFGIEERFSTHPLYIHYRARYLRGLQKHAEALAYLEEKEKYFFDARSKFAYDKERTQLLAKLGEFEKAKPTLNRLYQLGDREAGFMLVGAALAQQDTQEVLRLTEELTAKDAPLDEILIYSLLYRSSAFSELGDKAAAGEALHEILTKLSSAAGPLGLEMRFMRAGVYNQLEMYAEAVAEFDSITGFLADKEEAAPEQLKAALERIAEKRAEAAAKVQSFK